MKKCDLLNNPCWSATDLGKALPDSPHAVSVALPRWEDVIAYEEQIPDCIEALQSIYPRFGFNPLVAQVAQRAIEPKDWEDTSSWPYPNIETAQKAKKYCERKNLRAKTMIKETLGLSCLIVAKEDTSSAREFWQHTGLGASSRQAAIALNKEKLPSFNAGEEARASICSRLAGIYKCNSELIQLHPSGMAGLTTALELLRKFRLKSEKNKI